MRLKLGTISAFVGFAILITAVGASQTESIVIDKPMKARTLAATVELGDSDEGVKNVLVEECGPDWKSVERSTLTDDKGHFQFTKVNRKSLHYLRLSYPGAHTLLIKIKIDRSGPKELRLKLSFAT